MAELTQTAGSVVACAGAGRKQGVAADTITAGMPVYKHTDGTIKKAAYTSATLAAAVGIALNNASSGQPVEYCIGGDINLGATLAVGQTYAVATSGKIEDVPSLSAGAYITKLGIATTASNLAMKIHISGVVVPEP